MRPILLLTMAVAAAGLGLAQSDTSTITITASRNISVAADQVTYSVALRTDPGATLDDAVGQLTGTGITAANLAYATSGGGVGTSAGSITWTFQLTVPISKMKQTSATLVGLAQRLMPSGGTPALTYPALTYSVGGLATSQDAAAAGCTLAALVSDAQREAARLAAAAGVHVGGIVGLSDGGPAATFAVPTFVSRLGDFSTVVLDPAAGAAVAGVFSYIAPSVSCSMVVQFRMVN